MILRISSRTGSPLVALALLFTGCGMASAEMASEPSYMVVETESEGHGGAPIDFDEGEADGYADEARAESEPATPTPASATVGNPGPLFAQADDDSSDPPPTRKDDICANQVAKKLQQAEDLGEQVEIQQQVIDEGIEDADDLNDELAKILAELRREQGLEEEEPYMSPVQRTIDPILEELPSNPDASIALDRALDAVDAKVAAGAVEDTEDDTTAPPDEEFELVEPSLYDDDDEEDEYEMYEAAEEGRYEDYE